MKAFSHYHRHFAGALLASALTLATSSALAEDKSATDADPYGLQEESESTRDTADEPLLENFSVNAAAGYLDQHAHLVEKSCFACHSTFTYLPARSLIDPLAEEVMRSRVLLERLMSMLLNPAEASKVKTYHVSRVRILAAVELARHDAITTGTLAPLTRLALDAMWTLQKADGGIAWIHAKEAPQAIDDWWPVAMMALGAATAPNDYAGTPVAKAGIEKLRGWFHANPPQNNHERGLTLLADSAIGGIVSDDDRRHYVEAIFAAQRSDGGWNIADLAGWQRADGKPLDSTRSDGYPTGFLIYVLAKNNIPPGDARLGRCVEWLKNNQRRTGGWFTQSPFKRDKIASNTGTSFAIQALAACGEISTPKITSDQFASAHAAAEKVVPAGVFVPNSSEKPW